MPDGAAGPLPALGGTDVCERVEVETPFVGAGPAGRVPQCGYRRGTHPAEPLGRCPAYDGPGIVEHDRTQQRRAGQEVLVAPCPVGEVAVEAVPARRRGRCAAHAPRPPSQKSGVQTLPGQPQGLGLQNGVAAAHQFGHEVRRTVRVRDVRFPYGLVERLPRDLVPDHCRFVEQLGPQPGDPDPCGQRGGTSLGPAAPPQTGAEPLVELRQDEPFLR